MEGETPELLVRNKQLDGGPVQILSLPGHVLQSAHVASRLIGVAPRNGDAASVRDAVIRWRHARARGSKRLRRSRGSRRVPCHPASPGESSRPCAARICRSGAVNSPTPAGCLHALLLARPDRAASSAVAVVHFHRQDQARLDEARHAPVADATPRALHQFAMRTLAEFVGDVAIRSLAVALFRGRRTCSTVSCALRLGL